MRHGNPFGFGGRPRGRCVHIRLAGEEHILLAVLVPLYVRPQRLKRVIHRHVKPVQPKQILSTRGAQDAVEMVLFAINGVTGDSENVSKGLLCCVAGFAAPETQTQCLRPAD